MTHHELQLRMKQRLSTIEANAPSSYLLRIIEEVADQWPWQLLAGHEVATVATAETFLVTVRGDRYVQLARLGTDQHRKCECGTVTSFLDSGIGCTQHAPNARILLQGRRG